MNRLDGFQPSLSGRVVYSTVVAACSTDGCGFGHRQTSTNACEHVCRYMDRKDLAAMLTSIQSAGVTSEVNLRIAQTRKHARGSTLALKPRADCRQKCKTGVSVAPQKGLMSSKNFLKKTRWFPTHLCNIPYIITNGKEEHVPGTIYNIYKGTCSLRVNSSDKFNFNRRQ